ncbi:hypothetical protein ACFQER_03085 [Halomicroarcula sp. GCM10025894]
MTTFLGGDLGVKIILDAIGLPNEAWVKTVYTMWTPSDFPAYLFKFGVIASTITFLAAFAKLLLPDQLIENLKLTEGVKSLSQADGTIIVTWVLISIPIAYIIDYPLTLVAVAQLVLFVGMQVFYISLPSILHDWFTVPDKTQSVFTSLWIIVLAFTLALLGTHAFLFPIRVLQFYF